jgi:hypothetical protein
MLIPRSIERVSNVCFWPLAEHHGRGSRENRSNYLRAAIREQWFVQRVSGTRSPEFLDGLARAAIPCFERIRKVIWIRARIKQKRSLRRRQTKARDAEAAWKEHEEKSRAVRERTAQLRSLRSRREGSRRDQQLLHIGTPAGCCFQGCQGQRRQMP